MIGGDFHDGQIGLGIGADDLGLEVTAIVEGHGDIGGAVDDVVVGQHVPIGRDNHTGAGGFDDMMALGNKFIGIHAGGQLEIIGKLEVEVAVGIIFGQGFVDDVNVDDGVFERHVDRAEDAGKIVER